MPTIRVERTAVKPFFLGLFGFDHLQLVYEHSRAGVQDDWYVIEGVRDSSPCGPVLGVQGIDGQLTLARANAAARSALIEKIGTPEARGSIVISTGKNTDRLWSWMALEAARIDCQRLPYVALPAAREPACNSSSLVRTLLHRCGFHAVACLPPSVRLVPGFETIIDTCAQVAPRRSRRRLKRWPVAVSHGNHRQSDRRQSNRPA